MKVSRWERRAREDRETICGTRGSVFDSIGDNCRSMRVGQEDESEGKEDKRRESGSKRPLLSYKGYGETAGDGRAINV